MRVALFRTSQVTVDFLRALRQYKYIICMHIHIVESGTEICILPFYYDYSLQLVFFFLTLVSAIYFSRFANVK